MMKNYAYPDARGYYGPYGGQYVPETLYTPLLELTRAYQQARGDASFQKELLGYLSNYVGRPTPLTEAKHLSALLGKGAVFLKREDLCHTGAHKINNAMGQVLLAKRMGKKRVIAETGAGQHGVATATACAFFGLSCEVYMGEEDIHRQAPNVFRMKALGAKVISVTSGTQTLKDAVNEAMRDWVTNVRTTFYAVGSVIGPHPYPMMVRDFQAIIGREARKQVMAQTGQLPDFVLACVGGGSNAIGMFYPFLKDRNVKIIGIEPAGKGLDTHDHAASLCKGTPGVLHGARTLLLQDENGQITGTHSISAGLDYPGVGPEHSYLKLSGRVNYVGVNDQEALEGFKLLCKTEGILSALEPAHAIGYLKKLAPKLKKDSVVVICLSGRGDKDMPILEKHLTL